VEQHFYLNWVCFGKYITLGTIPVACLGGIMIQIFFIRLLFTCILLLLLFKKKRRKKERKRKRKRIVNKVIGKWCYF